MIAPDTSVLVAGFVSGHRFHEAAVSALSEVRAGGRLIAHTTAETFAVLSAPGGIYRAEPDAVVAYLDQFLDGSSPIQARPDAYREALGLLAGDGRAGGAIYDALIALTARDAQATLVSLDLRAERTYALCGIEARLLVDG
ncbi:MAG TPA: PIN domain-containing protein [Solirubrobacterales bacterium]|nr:PIN domain-containing protein [Solirubrobacterales bacterium]